MNPIFRSQPANNATYEEVLDAVDESFAAACTLFERSPAKHDKGRFDCYVGILQQAMDGQLALPDACEMILALTD